MTNATLAYLTPEARARARIDAMLVAAGWSVNDDPTVKGRERSERVTRRIDAQSWSSSKDA